MFNIVHRTDSNNYTFTAPEDQGLKMLEAEVL